MSRFFIDRPVFAWVIALIIMLVGGIAVLTLPIDQYPPIAPPPITISVTYPGASAETVQDTVISPIEQEMYGLDGLEYMSSNGQADGSMQIVLTFAQGTDPNIAQVQVQNKLALAEPMLPEDVTATGDFRHQGDGQLHDDRRLHLHRRIDGYAGDRRLRRFQHRKPAVAHFRGRRLHAVRRRIFDAHLARPGPAEQLRA